MQTSASGVCGSCQGRGVIMQDIGADQERAHRCPMGCRPGSSSASTSATSAMAPVGRAELRQMLTRRPADRYCDVCLDPASRDDLLPNRFTVHKTRICTLWRPETRVELVSVGDVISYYRVLNRNAPVLIEGMIPLESSERPRSVLYMRHIRWEPDGVGLLRLTADGPLTERTVDLQDLVALADRSIKSTPVEASRVPPAWVSAPQYWAATNVIKVPGTR